MTHQTTRHAALAASALPDAWTLLRTDYENARERLERQDAIAAPFGDGAAMDAYEEAVDQVATDHADALNAMMLHPAPDTAALRLKLQAFHDAEIANGWRTVAQIVAQLADDGRRLLN